LFICLLIVGLHGYDVQPPVISLLQPQGITFIYPDDPPAGISLFAVHYSINKPVHGVAAGDWNFDVPTVTGDQWIHENRNVVVKPGDYVGYWIYLITSTGGHQLTDQIWHATATTPPTTPATTPATTAATTPATTPGTTPATTPGETPPSTTDHTGPTLATTTAPGDVECDQYPCLIWSDDFDFLDFTKWDHEITAGGGGNWEFQYYTNNRSNSYTRDGSLYLKPTLTEDRLGPGSVTTQTLDLWGMAPSNKCTGEAFYGCLRDGNPSNILNPVQSARIRSVHRFNFRYGRVEIMARMPRGDWIWPAIWLLPETESYGLWPASGEIDIVESRGNADLVNGGESIGNDHMGTTLHWGPYFPVNGYMKTTASKNDDYGDNLHKYTLEWDDNLISISVDDELVLNVPTPENGFWEHGDFNLPDNSNPWISSPNKNAPFDRSFYFVLNAAVGGTNGFFPDSAVNAGYPKPWNNQSPTALRDFWNAKTNWYPTWNPDVNNGEDAAMQVDYIRVWKLRPDEARMGRNRNKKQ
jgi:hypothetical protein